MLPPDRSHPQEASAQSERCPWARRLALAHGVFYAASGIWPILSIRSFEKVTGPKTDRWLVKTVGALISVLGGTLTASAVRGCPSKDLVTAAAGSAAVLAVIDVLYVARDRISRVYLLDAVVELALVVAWGLADRANCS